MASLESAFKRHSRAQVATVPAVAHSKTKEPLSTPSPAFRSDGVVRRSRVLNAQSSPSWVPSSQVANERKQVSLARESLPVLAETTVPRLTPSHSSLTTLRWLDLVQLGKLVQGADEWLICSSRVEKKLYMLRGAEDRDATAVQKTVPFKHPHIVAAAFSVTSSDVRSFVGFPYVRFTLEELLYAHIKMDESQIQAVATSVCCPAL